MEQPLYFDHNATTPVRTEVAEAIAETLALGGNASSVHAAGRRARQMVEEARENIAKLVNVRPAEIVFTSGGTEANNLVLRGVSADNILVSAVEHDSVLEAAENVEQLAVDDNGLVDLVSFEKRLAELEGQTLVSVMLANNETGVIEPIAEIAAIAKKHGAYLHSDAIQALSKIDIDRAALGVDFLSLSAHKIGGPQGVGVLVVNEEIPLTALIRGGGQERFRRAGTENVPGIVGFGAAAKLALTAQKEVQNIKALRDRLEAEIKAISPEALIFGADVIRLPNTSCIAMPGVTSETQVMKFDLTNVMVSAGSACSSGKVQSSHVLKAMGVDDAIAETSIRVSLGFNNTLDEVGRFVDQWRQIYAHANPDKLKGAA